MKQFPEDIFALETDQEFDAKALEIFRIQSVNVPVYREFIRYMRIDPSSVSTVLQIPFIPAGFFKHHKIIQTGYNADREFISSGTTGPEVSCHFVADTKIYSKSILKAFRLFYGDPAEYCILALLPSYLERGNSSLAFMADLLIKESGHPAGGFYLNEYRKLIEAIYTLKRERCKILLLGVSFALLDLAEQYNPDFSGTVIMETGGMKGRRREITREELHGILCEKLNVPVIHSEYGMTELLSQAYSASRGLFKSPPWMKIMIRDPYDPGAYLEEGRTGSVNIIDLANFYSCSFIATSDLGRIVPGKGFEIIGRMDNSDIRGCNLLVS